MSHAYYTIAATRYSELPRWYNMHATYTTRYSAVWLYWFTQLWLWIETNTFYIVSWQPQYQIGSHITPLYRNLVDFAPIARTIASYQNAAMQWVANYTEQLECRYNLTQDSYGDVFLLIEDILIFNPLLAKAKSAKLLWPQFFIFRVHSLPPPHNCKLGSRWFPIIRSHTQTPYPANPVNVKTLAGTYVPIGFNYFTLMSPTVFHSHAGYNL